MTLNLTVADRTSIYNLLKREGYNVHALKFDASYNSKIPLTTSDQRTIYNVLKKAQYNQAAFKFLHSQQKLEEKQSGGKRKTVAARKKTPAGKKKGKGLSLAGGRKPARRIMPVFDMRIKPAVPPRRVASGKQRAGALRLAGGSYIPASLITR